jgi:hypothetical protein
MTDDRIRFLTYNEISIQYFFFFFLELLVKPCLNVEFFI